MRKFCIAIIVSAIIAWSCIYFYAIYKTNAFIEQFSSEQVQITYNKLYVKIGLKHPISIIIKDMVARTDDIVCNVNLYLYPSFSNIFMKLSLTAIHKEDKFIMPFTVSAKRSPSNNFYLSDFSIDNAKIYINKSNITINGGVTLYKDKLPIGGYELSISDTQKLLSSDLFTSYPNILYKIKNILAMIEDDKHKIQINYTENGILIDGKAIENI